MDGKTPEQKDLSEAHAKCKTSHKAARVTAQRQRIQDVFVRAENEDDDGYDPYSDRPALREKMFQENPWD